MKTLVALLVLISASLTAQAAAPATVPVAAELNLKSLPPGQPAVVAVVVDVPEGLHAQSSQPTSPNYIPFKVTIDPNPSIELSPPIYSPGKLENYELLGQLSVYTGRVITYVPLRVKEDAKPGPLTLSGVVQYQMCNDRACFPPKRPKISIQTTIAEAGTKAEPNHPELFADYKGGGATSAPATALSAQNLKVTEVASDITIDVFGWKVTLGRNAYGIAFVCAFVVGIFFNFMPCVLPVVPLKAMGFYEVSQHNRAKSLALGLVFSLGLVASFAVLGLIVVAKQWFRWGELFGNPWFLSALVLVLIVMALSMFGAFTVNLPTTVYAWTPRHDTYTGNFLFGILTAALSTPCTFGMFFGLLAWALAQPVAVGVMLMVMVGAGMAFPYLVLSAFPELARRFPRTGPWAETIKMLMGFLLLGTAAYFAGPFINRLLGAGAFWWVIFAVVLAAGLFLVWRSVRFSPGMAPRLAAVVIAIVMIVPSFYVVRLMTVKPYAWQPYTPQTLSTARDSNKIVLIDFTADWCGNCHWVEAFVLNSRLAIKTIDDHRVVMLKADVSKDDAPGRPLLNELNPVGAIPLTAIYAPGLAQPIQLNGIYSVKDLQEAIARAVAATGIRADAR
jgi:thiol:disulfide interchange protein